jgi:putative transposase
MSEALKTITLKLHDIGSYKKDIIDEAMMNYSRAFQYLLDALYCDIENTKNDKDGKDVYSLFDVKKLIGKDLIENLNEFNIEPFKDSLIIDFSAVISGYLNSLMNGREQSYPSVFISDEKFEHEYNELMNEYIENVEDPAPIEEKIKRLIALKDRSRPIFFCRYATCRNYCLLYDPEKNRYYAKIYLMNVKNEKRKVSLVNSEKSIKYISKDNKIFEKSTRKNCFLVFSLSFGSYQEEFLKKALKDPEILRTARLIKKKDDYFLSISIIEKFEQSIETLNYMGISRGIDCAVSYTVVDLNGNKLFENFIDSEKIPVQDCEINRIANTLLKISREHKCQVIMENLQNSRDRLTYTDKDGKYFTQY